LQPIRILIAELPTMLRDIVLDTVADQPDMEVVGVVERGAQIAREVGRTGATVVIVRASGGQSAAAPSPWMQRDVAGPCVVALTSDGREAFVQVALGEISPERLLHTIRQLPTIRFDD
jgi:AmiR/NasT family two-component response regulator